MTTIVAIIFLLIVYRYVCYLREASLSLKYKHSIFKLRDKLRYYAINGDIPNDDFFMMFDAMLTGQIKHTEDLNIYYLFLRNLFIVSVTEKDLNEFKKNFLEPIRKNSKYSEIYNKSHFCFYEYLSHKHVIVFTLIRLIISISSTIRNLIRTTNEKIWYDSSHIQNLNYEHVLLS
jgi:hypothetical protein